MDKASSFRQPVRTFGKRIPSGLFKGGLKAFSNYLQGHVLSFSGLIKLNQTTFKTDLRSLESLFGHLA